LRVGDLVLLEKNQRVPADLVLLRTSESSGTCFIRTDQLDGETDWKLRVAVSECQKLNEGDLVGLDAEIYGKLVVSKLIRATKSRLVQLMHLSRISMPLSARFTLNKPTPSDFSDSSVPLNNLPPSVSPLTVENVLWSNTVLAAGSAVGFVIYTGSKTCAVMNTSHPGTKVGLLDLEINRLAKVSLFFFKNHY
jgi:phospholipid-translocating ATPase